MNVLVTGGAGFIGSHIVDACIERGYKVAIVDSLLTGHRRNLNPAATFYEIDIRSEALGGVFEEAKPNVVFHLAAQMNVTLSLKKPVFDSDINVAGTVNLLQNCVDHGVGRFIFSSTAGAMYGEPDSLPVDENTVPAPLSHYGTSKLCGEAYVALYHRLYGLPYVILRYSNVYGPRQSPHGEAGVCAIFATLMLKGETPILYGHGDPVRDYVYVRDVVRGNLLAMEKGDGEIVNISTGKGTAVREIHLIEKELTGFKGEPALKPLRNGEVNKVYVSPEHARRVLGWEPEVSLRDGLERTVHYFREALS